MSEASTDSTGTGHDDDVEGDGRNPTDGAARAEDATGGTDDPADGGADAGADPASDLAKSDEVSTGTDGVGGGNDSRSSVLQDTLGAGGDPEDVERAL